MNKHASDTKCTSNDPLDTDNALGPQNKAPGRGAIFFKSQCGNHKSKQSSSNGDELVMSRSLQSCKLDLWKGEPFTI